MTHSSKQDAEAKGTPMPYDGTEGTEPIVIQESDATPYQLLSVPRWNKDVGIVENTYEIYNTQTKVVESRLRSNMVTAISVYEAIVDLFLDYQKAGSVKAMDAGESAVSGPSTH